LGDDTPCKIVGMGKVKIKKRNGNEWLLKEVRHVLDLRKNLILTGKLASEGYISVFTDKVWKITKGSLVIEKGEKVGTLYLCTANTHSSISLASIGELRTKGRPNNNIRIHHHLTIPFKGIKEFQILFHPYVIMELLY
jgi:hypothetical protein